MGSDKVEGDGYKLSNESYKGQAPIVSNVVTQTEGNHVPRALDEPLFSYDSFKFCYSIRLLVLYSIHPPGVKK